MNSGNDQRIAVLIPCYNEAVTVASVIRNFAKSLPDAAVYVFDNNSTDDTASLASSAGAIVRKVVLQGKGNVIRRMFADIEADIFVLVDGDDTYDASAAPVLVERLVSEGLDMVVGSRVSSEDGAYRLGHRLGNALLSGFVAALFGRTFSDMLSGYRVFSRRYVKSFAAIAAGFEIETELTIHALELRMPVAEIKTRYVSRPEGSTSKLNTYVDGFKILLTIFKLFKSEKPLLCFSLGFFVCLLLSTSLSLPLFATYLETGLVPRLPTALICVALMLLGSISLVCGIVLDTVTLGRAESKHFAYLSISAPAVQLPPER